jgi:hypothetical protein
VSLVNIKKQLSEDERAKAAATSADAAVLEMMAWGWKKTVVQETEIQTKCTALLKAIQKFRKHQHAYMPGLITHLNNIQFKEPEEALSKPETMQLFLPSHFPNHSIHHNVCPNSLAVVEQQLREVQMVEVLSNLQWHLQKQLYVGQLKNKNSNGQSYWLQSNSFISEILAAMQSHQKELLGTG